ncbi:MAG TPA: carboxymuconolactone decarboxylase family protein [Isosphaeraceae bacterium]|nr:carboxymuconolactone decarboxylase family protein [Isosphaeraceae bacterium]
MALVSLVSNQNAAEKIKPVFEGMEKKLGVVPNIFRAMAHYPEMLEAFLALNATLPRTELNGRLRELAYIKTSELNGCDYCLHHHRTLGKKAGLNDRQVADTAQSETSDAYDDLERDVMRYAEEVTRHINVDDALVGRLKQQLDDREIVELAMTVGIANFTNRVTETLRMELP